MFERYTEQARRALFFARYESSQLGSMAIESEHLLLGLLRERVDIHDLIPESAADAVRQQLLDEAPKHPRTSTSVEIPFTKQAKQVLETAAREADGFTHAHIGTEHLLLALAITPETDRVLNAHGVVAETLRQQIRTRTTSGRVRQLEQAMMLVQSIGEEHDRNPDVRRLVEQLRRDLESLRTAIAGPPRDEASGG
jgi:ATP-dependent Clp protease ATP-binding subunit ClpC